MGQSGDNWEQRNYPRQKNGRRPGRPAVPPQWGPPGQGTPGGRPQSYQQPRYQPPPQRYVSTQAQFTPRPQYTAPRQYPPQQQYAPPGQPPYQQPRYATSQQYQQPAPPRKRSVFLWVFLAVQVLFVVLIATLVAAHPDGPTAAQQAAQQCAHGGWQGLFKSQADCDKHYAVALNDAGNVGKGIGVVLIVVIWMVIDFFLGLGYGIYRLASRR